MYTELLIRVLICCHQRDLMSMYAYIPHRITKNPVPRGITELTCSWGRMYKYGDLAFQIGGLRWENNVWLWVLGDSNQWVVALQTTDQSSCQRGRPAWRRKRVIVIQKNFKIRSCAPKGKPDTKANWPADRRSQNELYLTSLHLRNLWSWASRGFVLIRIDWG
jgi:hypothetical protein